MSTKLAEIYTNQPIVATPLAAQKPWVDLSDEEIDALAELHGLDYMSYDPFSRALEQRLKEKNT